MPILEADIQLIKSQVLDDVPEGGGAATGTELVDGQSNNLFNDISELDRIYGDVGLRKVFVGVRTQNTDGYFGAHLIVSDPPDDPDVSAILFSTEDSFDVRSAAASRIEAYLAQGSAYQGLLFGNHLAGQMTVMVIQRPSIAAPTIGASLVLRKNEGLVSEVEQFVRVTDVSSQLRTFTDAATNTDFDRLVVTMSISDQLQADFPGFDAVKADAAINYTGKTKVYDTVVADAARYYGVVPLTEVGEVGDFTIQAEGIFSQLVPSTQVETPIADARMNQQTAPPTVAGATVTTNPSMVWTTGVSMFIGGSILPGSLTITASGITLTDAGGLLLNDTTEVGAIDYENGIAVLSTSVFGSGGQTFTVTYTPAGTPTLVSESIGIPVTAEGQRLTYVITLDPPPARGTLQVSYRAQGRWYTLTEDGTGAIRGADSALGAGTLNYSTGTVSLTLGALPDVGSRVILSYAGGASVAPLSSVPGAVTTGQRFRRVIFLNQPIKPGTLSITWNDGVARTATDDPVTSSLTGDATGAVYYASGRIEFSPNTLPPLNTNIAITVTDSIETNGAVSAFTDGGSTWTGTLSANIRPRTLEMSIAVSFPVRQFPGVDVTQESLLRVFDDGAGLLKVANVTGNLTVGTINYTTGAFSINKSNNGFQSVQSKWEKQVPYMGNVNDPAYIKLVGSETRSLTMTVLNAPTGAVTSPSWAWWTGAQTEAAKTRFGTTDGTGLSTSFALDYLFLSASGLTYGYENTAQYGGYSAYSTRTFKLGADNYQVRGTDVFKNISPTTGEGTLVGAYGGYVEGIGVRLTAWTAGVTTAVSSKTGTASSAASGSSTTQLVDAAVFRTASAPVKTGSFSVTGTFQNGSTFSATADNNGNIATGSAVSGSTPGSYGVFGTIDYQFGVADIRFGRRVPASMASNTGVTDLSYLGIPGVQYVESRGVQSDTLRYNASAYSYLPLDADLLGLNPVRLPPDGRVPIFRAGTVAVVHHSAETTPAVVSNGQTVNLGRTRLARVRVIGANGVTITSGYGVNLDAGTVTFSDVTGYSQPVKIEHRIEDAALVADAQINGLLRLTRPLTHDFPDGSYVSSALLIGDMKARVSSVFDQVSWTSVWSDDPIGSPATGTFDTINYPPVVTNLSAVTERWALIFTGSTVFNIVGEHLGLIGTGTTGADCAPLNPATDEPYFHLDFEGFGNGWATGNVIRINTVGALAPIWVARVVKQGVATETDDSFTLLVRGDSNTP